MLEVQFSCLIKGVGVVGYSHVGFDPCSS